jgi:hypothetical protein
MYITNPTQTSTTESSTEATTEASTAILTTTKPGNFIFILNGLIIHGMPKSAKF